MKVGPSVNSSHYQLSWSDMKVIHIIATIRVNDPGLSTTVGKAGHLHSSSPIRSPIFLQECLCSYFPSDVAC